MTVPVQIYDSISGANEGSPAYGSAAELRLTKTNDAALAPGRFVTRDGNDRKVKVPTSVAEVLACVGIAELSETQILSSNTSGNYPANTRLSVVRKGVIWMVAVAAAVQGADVYVYYGAGDTTLRGKVGGTFSSGENVKLPGAKFWTTQATPGSLVAVEVDLPAGAASESAAARVMTAVVTYDGSGVPTVGAQGGLSVVDTGTGVFQLIVAGATSVLPFGSPIKKKATPDSSDAPASLFEVEAIAATSVTYSHRVLQADATPNGDAADPANGDVIYVGLLVTY